MNFTLPAPETLTRVFFYEEFCVTPDGVKLLRKSKNYRKIDSVRSAVSVHFPFILETPTYYKATHYWSYKNHNAERWVVPIGKTYVDSFGREPVSQYVVRISEYSNEVYTGVYTIHDTLVFDVDFVSSRP